MIKPDRAVPRRPNLGIGTHTYDPETPNLYRLGGLVEANQMGRPPRYSYMKVKNMGVDQVPTLLQHGEIVIPVKHVKKVAEFLKSQNINLPNMDKLPK